MRLIGTALTAALLAAALLSTGAARADSTPIGLWIDHTGRGAVEITECGGKLCGHIAWLKDSKNADACGEQVLGDVKPIGGGKWDNGWIYDPDAAAKYDVEITPVGADTLRVMGYAGTKWLSETMTWKRAPADLKKCTKAGSASATPAATTPVAMATPPPAVKAETRTETKPETKTVVAGSTPDAPKADKDKADKDKKTAKPDSETIVAGIAQALTDAVETDDSKPRSTKSKRTCKMDVPYLEMVVTFPCDD